MLELDWVLEWAEPDPITRPILRGGMKWCLHVKGREEWSSLTSLKTTLNNYLGIYSERRRFLKIILPHFDKISLAKKKKKNTKGDLERDKILSILVRGICVVATRVILIL